MGIVGGQGERLRSTCLNLAFCPAPRKDQPRQKKASSSGVGVGSKRRYRLAKTHSYWLFLHGCMFPEPLLTQNSNSQHRAWIDTPLPKGTEPKGTPF